MPLGIQNIAVEDATSFPYIVEQNVDVPLHTYETGLVRANIYRPHDTNIGNRYPVLVTYGPYGKDVHYGDFRKDSFNQVNPEHRSAHSAWEVPDPGWWTERGYILVRADERGVGQSPGKMDTMSRGTSEAFSDVVTWASEQPWSTGKVGLLGISYYAGTQWRVAARKPKGLAAIVPWEGMSDYYRDRCRHGGIYSSAFINFWWNGQVKPNQYGRPRRPGSKIPATIEGTLSEEELNENLQDQTVDNRNHRFMDEDYYASRDFRIEDIEVPLLSVANWGGSLLHLRGNVQGFTHASSKFKFLRFIVGRHDLPFYEHDEALLQKSFLDAFLKGQDPSGWTRGDVQPISMVLREGDVGFNDMTREKGLQRREETAWPLPQTQYTRYYLNTDKSLTLERPEGEAKKEGALHWLAMAMAPRSERPPAARGPPPVREFSKQSSLGMLKFTTPPFADRTEFTGHVTAHLNVRIPKRDEQTPSDIDLFVTIRHLDEQGKEIYYTGTAGDPVPVTKGWLRCSLRKIDESHPHHREYLPHRNYFSTDMQPLEVGETYPVDIEIWPTNVVVSSGNRLVFEIAGADTQGSGVFTHEDPVDRPEGVFKGLNELVFAENVDNYLTLPLIPSA